MASISTRGRCRSCIRRGMEFASRHPKSLAVANKPADRNFECIPMWRFGNSRARQENSGFAGTDGQRQFYFLGALGRRRCRKRTPGPPPLSSMNSTPAASKARRTAKSFAVVMDVSSSVSSARRIVVTLRAVSRARSSALQRMSARAALICALVSGFTTLLTLSCIMLFFIP